MTTPPPSSGAPSHISGGASGTPTTATQTIHPDTIQIIAQTTLGGTHQQQQRRGDTTTLHEDIAGAVASDVEYRVRELVQDALRLARHARRPHTLHTKDINHALLMANMQPLYGFTGSGGGTTATARGVGGGGGAEGPAQEEAPTQAAAGGHQSGRGGVPDDGGSSNGQDDNNNTGGGGGGVTGDGGGPEEEGEEKGGGKARGDQQQRQRGGVGVLGGKERTLGDLSRSLRLRSVSKYPRLFFVEDYEKSVLDMDAAPMALPRGPTVRGHWLAIQGTQPRIPQNPILHATPQATQQQQQDIGLSTSDPILDSLISANIGSNGVPADVAGQNVQQQKKKQQLVKHVLSRELQMYHTRVCSIVLHRHPDSDLLLPVVLRSLQQDAGIHQLVPYLTQFVSYEVTTMVMRMGTDDAENGDGNAVPGTEGNVKSKGEAHTLRVLKSLMELLHRLLCNRHLHMELYLHQIMPPVMTCLLVNFDKHGHENGRQSHRFIEYALRDAASQVLGLVCTLYSDSYPTLQHRITRTLAMAFLDPEKSMSTHYGCIVGIHALGPRVVESLLMEPHPYSNLHTYHRFHFSETSRRQAETEEQGSSKATRSTMVHGALLSSACTYLHRVGKSIAASVIGSEKRQLQQERGNERSLVERMNAVNMPEHMDERYKELYSVFGESLLPAMPYARKIFERMIAGSQQQQQQQHRSYLLVDVHL